MVKLSFIALRSNILGQHKINATYSIVQLSKVDDVVLAKAMAWLVIR